MDTPVISALAALAGSLIGGASTFSASWLTTRTQQRHQTRLQDASRRLSLYSEFILEASKRLTEAWNHGAEGPAVIANLYAQIEQMRLMSSDEVIAAAEAVVLKVVDIYASPNRSDDSWRSRDRSAETDPLRTFSDACRKELKAARG